MIGRQESATSRERYVWHIPPEQTVFMKNNSRVHLCIIECYIGARDGDQVTAKSLTKGIAKGIAKGKAKGKANAGDTTSTTRCESQVTTDARSEVCDIAMLYSL